MQEMPFIFSRQKRYILLRHAAFWLTSLLGQGLIILSISSFFHKTNNERWFDITFGQILLLPGQLFLVYAVSYGLLPRFIITGRHRTGFFLFFLACVVAGMISACSWALLIDPVSQIFYQGCSRCGSDYPLTLRLTNGFIQGLRSALVVTGFAASLKLMKYWYDKQHSNSMLEKEKLNAELKSLKAQVHPHFLFNTLNNIYAITQKTSQAGSEMIAKLSDLLRYILYECDKPLVPLDQEFRMLVDYVALEKIRYDENLDLDVIFPERGNGMLIAPLLLLPLVENCFKHGSSKMAGACWIQLHASIKDQTLRVKLINSKPVSEKVMTVQYGLGLNNVIKRLEHLYPSRYQLDIISEADIFVVNLQIQLQEI